MIVQRESVRKHSTSCNFCNKGKLNEYHNGLRYPYEDVVTFKRAGNGLCAAICEECLNELIDKAKGEFTTDIPAEAKPVLAIHCILSKDDEIGLYEKFHDEFTDKDGLMKPCNPDAIFNWFGWQLWRSKQ